MSALPLSLPAEAENELSAEAEVEAAGHGRHGALTVAPSAALTGPADTATATFFAAWLAREYPGTAWEVEIDARSSRAAADDAAEDLGTAA